MAKNMYLLKIPNGVFTVVLICAVGGKPNYDSVENLSGALRKYYARRATDVTLSVEHCVPDCP